MASRKASRTKRSRRPLDSLHRARRSLLPLPEAPESRVVLSGRPVLVPPNLAVLSMSVTAPSVAGDDGFVPVPLANGFEIFEVGVVNYDKVLSERGKAWRPRGDLTR